MTLAHRKSLTAVILAMAMVNMIFGLSFPLLALVLDRQGVAPFLIGLSTAVQAVSVFFVAPFARRLTSHVGPARIMFFTLIVSGVVMAALPLWPNIWAWFPLRFILGVSGSLLWMVSEAWINSLTGDATRGRVIGLYTAVAAAGAALGPILLIVTGSESIVPFYAAAGVMIGAALMVLMAENRSAAFAGGNPGRAMWRLVLIAPAPLLVNLFYAAADESMMTFFPIYAIDLGTSEQAALVLMTIAAFGAIAFQLPVGWLADRFDRRLLLALLAGVSIVLTAGIPWALDTAWMTLPYFLVFGGLTYGINTVALVLLGQRFSGAELAAATAISTAMWGAGSLIGAPLVGQVMEWLPPHGMIVAVTAIYAAYLPLPLISWLRARRAAEVLVKDVERT